MLEKDLKDMQRSRPPKANLGKGKVRTPTVQLEPGMGGGWGEHELSEGSAVEVCACTLGRRRG